MGQFLRFSNLSSVQATDYTLICHRVNATVMLRSYNFARPPVKMATLMKDFERAHRNNRSHSHTSIGPISSKQSLMPHHLYPAMRRIYRRLVRRECSVIFFQPLRISGSGELAAIASYVCKRLSIDWYWHPS